MPGDKKRTSAKARHAKSQPVSVKNSKGARRRKNMTQQTRRQKSGTSYSAQGLSITVQLPAIRKPRSADRLKNGKTPPPKVRKFARPKVLIPLALLVISFGVIAISVASDPQKKVPAATAAERTKPDFEPLRPSAEEASEPKYDAKRNLVSYTTTFSGARLTVSQQQKPPNFDKDPDALKKAADSIGAKKLLDTAKGPLYIANNDKSNAQLAIFTSANVLVFVRTDRTIDDASWKSFVDLLKAKKQ